MSSEPAGARGETAVRLRGAGKAYPSFARPLDRLVQLFVGRRRQLYQEFWALHPLDLEVRRGEVLGIVGHNGAGKSTLLQMVAGTLRPSHGECEVMGRLSALLELGAGFNPEFTGRENVLLAASLQGMSRRESEARFPEIVEFSGLGEFIDQPVKTYSSGMFVRLAFSVAVSVDPEVLIIDEALSVGDGAFARRSFDRILRFKEQGKTILFCSHSLFQVESICTRAIWLDHGRVQRIGPPAEVVAAYQAHLDRLAGGQAGGADTAPPAPHIASPGHARIASVALSIDGQGDNRRPVRSGHGEIEVMIAFDSDPGLDTPQAAATIDTPDGRILASTGTWMDAVALERDEAGRGQARVCFPRLPLLKGDYVVSAYLFCERGLHIYSAAERFARFSVVQDHLEQGIVSLPHRWSVAPGPLDRVPAMPPEPRRLDLPAEWSSHWQVRWSENTDFEALQALFFSAFGADIGHDVWCWKYRDAPVWGMLATREGGPAAFFGGMPRSFVQGGQAFPAVQIGDVMVKPSERGTLSRRGPLYRAAAAYFGHMDQVYPQVRFAFGFPSARHLRLGVKLGVYVAVDAVSQLAWTALPQRRRWSLRTREIALSPTGPEARRIDALWAEMQGDWPDLLLPLRDAARWHYRYVEHPERRYRILLVRRRLTGRPVAALALRIHADRLEWIDYLGGRSGIGPAVLVLRTFAGALGLNRVEGWFSAAAAEALGEGATIEPTEVAISVNALGSADAGQAPGRLWLMGGDSDFR